MLNGSSFNILLFHQITRPNRDITFPSNQKKCIDSMAQAHLAEPMSSIFLKLNIKRGI